MSKAIITEQHLHDIADAIIAKGGATGPMTPAQMAAAIQAIPSGGGEYKDIIAAYFNKTLESINLADILGYDSPDPVYVPTRGVFEAQTHLKTIYAPMMNITVSYSLHNCTALETATFRNTANNTVSYISTCTSLKELTFTAMSSSTLLTYATFLGAIAESCTIHCTDMDVKYIDGAWVAVERS